RRTRTEARRSRRARRADSARRRSPRAPASSPGGHLSFDASRVLLELERVGRELDDPLLSMERIFSPHVDVSAGEFDHVVTGSSVSTKAQRGHRPRVDDEEILEAPGVGDVLVPGEDEVDTRAL